MAKKENTLAIRLEDIVYDEVEKLSKHLDISMSAYARHLIIKDLLSREALDKEKIGDLLTGWK